MKQVVLIGYGAMAKEIHQRLPAGVCLSGLIVPSRHLQNLRAQYGSAFEITSDIRDLQHRPDLFVECAGHAGLAEHGPDILASGAHLAVISVGALADPQLQHQLYSAAQRGHGRLEILSGAVAGMDGLAAAREAGLSEVIYTASKAPNSWRGSHAEHLIDLDTVSRPTVFFTGSAGEAARLFPANANVAATVALHGLGLQQTQVQLSVDPTSQRNTHHILARGNFGEMRIEIAGAPLPSNPKTSMLAALSAVYACRQLLQLTDGSEP